MTTTSKEEQVRRATAFGRQSATPAVRRRVALNYTTLSSYCSDMNYRPWNSVYSRDVYNLSILGITPLLHTILQRRFLFFFFEILKLTNQSFENLRIFSVTGFWERNIFLFLGCVLCETFGGWWGCYIDKEKLWLWLWFGRGLCFCVCVCVSGVLLGF